MGWRAVHISSPDRVYSLVVTDSSVTGANLGNLPSGLTNPQGIGYGDDRWLVVDTDGDDLWRINPDNPGDTSGVYGRVGNLRSALGAPRGIGYGDDRWLVVDAAGDDLWRINPDNPGDISGDYGEVGNLPSGADEPAGHRLRGRPMACGRRRSCRRIVAHQPGQPE